MELLARKKRRDKLKKQDASLSDQTCEGYLSLQEKWHEKDQSYLREDAFLAFLITDVIYLNKDGERIYGHNNAPPQESPHRVIAQIQHIELERFPIVSEGKKTHKYVASNLQLDIEKAETLPDMAKALHEKALAAIALVRMAKAEGHTEANFGNTRDPVEKLALMLACHAENITFEGDMREVAKTLPTCPALTEDKKQDPKARLIKEMEAAINNAQHSPVANMGIDPPVYPDAQKDIEDVDLEDLFGIAESPASPDKDDIPPIDSEEGNFIWGNGKPIGPEKHI